jgi:hypothetical protein
MSTRSYREAASQRIAHVKKHLEVGFDLEQVLHNIGRNAGNRPGREDAAIADAAAFQSA